MEDTVIKSNMDSATEINSMVGRHRAQLRLFSYQFLARPFSEDPKRDLGKYFGRKDVRDTIT